MAGSDIHLNLSVRGLRPSATVATNERSDALRRAGRDVFKLGLGQSPFPVPEPVTEALRRNAHQKDYLPVRGLPALRAAVAEHHAREFGVPCTAEQVLVGPGSKELMFILQLVYYGEIVIPTPSWVSYAPQAQIVGRTIRWLETRPHAAEGGGDGWKVTAAQLDALCRDDPSKPRILILNYPCNPTGGTYTREELAELAETARRYGVLVLSDEIYGRLHHGRGHASMAPLYPEGTIVSTGLSKWCGAGGWRLGVFIVPEPLRWLLEAMTAVASETFTSTSAPIQHAAIDAFGSDPALDEYLLQSNRVLRALGQHLHARLEAVQVPTLPPAGGFYLFPDFSRRRGALLRHGIDGSRALTERALEETGVAFLPGADFGRPPEELTARLAYVNFDGAAAIEAARGRDGELDEAFLRARCARTVEAVDRLCDWVASL